MSCHKYNYININHVQLVVKIIITLLFIYTKINTNTPGFYVGIVRKYVRQINANVFFIVEKY